jgi:hypothetical protein
MSNDKEGENKRRKYGLLPNKIVESDTIFLSHGLCGSGDTTSITIRKPSKTYFQLVLTIIDPVMPQRLV